MDGPYNQNFKSANELFISKSDISLIVKDTRNKNVSGKRLLVEQPTIPSFASKKRAIGKIGCIDGEISFCSDEIQGVLKDSIILYRQMIRKAIAQLQGMTHLPLREVMTAIRSLEQEMAAFIEEDEMNEDIVSLFSDENEDYTDEVEKKRLSEYYAKHPKTPLFPEEEDKDIDGMMKEAGISQSDVVEMEKAVYTV